MFRPIARNLRDWWAEVSDDILGADLNSGTPEAPDLDHHLCHPHRRPLASPRSRRAGTVPPRPAYCLSPVAGPEHDRSDRRARAWIDRAHYREDEIQPK